MAKKDQLATVLAFEKKLVPSDGFFYGTSWAQRHEESACQPLTLQEKSVRGTISNRLKAADRDPLKIDAAVEKANLQRVDNCALGTDQDTLRLQFTLKVLGGVQQPSACNLPSFQQSYLSAAEAYIEAEGFTELAKRYAINIANGRFLWRNRVGAENIEVIVKVSGEETQWTFDALNIGTRDFSVSMPDIDALAERIASALSGRTSFVLLEINAYAQVGKAQDVYPSEELVLDKGSSGKGAKSKVLYSINDVAGMHSQKIGNALRTIDTWYPGYHDVSTGPIAVEPYGSVTNLGIAYRKPTDNSDFYSLFDRFALGETLNSKEEEHYVMAVLVRGGVFGSTKE